ncbi:MAG: hypothetical protein R3E48_00410 [Burkholderiaceae bacterium]
MQIFADYERPAMRMAALLATGSEVSIALGPGTVRVGCEAAMRFGWDRWLRERV